MSIKFEVLHVCKQSGARLGRLTTPHGVLEFLKRLFLCL